MRIFFSAGEPSGDLHGSNLVQALRLARPDLECVGFGGPRMEAAGCHLLYPLSQLAVVGFGRVLANLRTFLRLQQEAEDFFRTERPDAVVLIDFPGFHWGLARRAKALGIPVYYFVPPQLWAWAGWRVRKMRRWVDHVLCSLPFEVPWFQARGVPAQYFGHPYFDELPRQRLDEAFLAAEQGCPGTIIGLLPGSRNQELENNLTTLLGAAAHIHTAHPETRFLVACFKEEHRQQVERKMGDFALPVDVHVGRTAEIIHLSRACIAVSGSVSLELLYHEKPSVVVYRANWFLLWLSGFFKTCPYISLVNLLAGKELYPEVLTCQDEAESVARQVLRWLEDDRAYRDLCEELAELRGKVAVPGACERAAAYVLETVKG